VVLRGADHHPEATTRPPTRPGLPTEVVQLHVSPPLRGPPSPAARVHLLVMALPTACDRLLKQIAGLLAELAARHGISSIRQVGMPPSWWSPQKKAVPTSRSLHSKPRERSCSLSGWTLRHLSRRAGFPSTRSAHARSGWVSPRSNSTPSSTPQLPSRLPAGVVGASPASTSTRRIRTCTRRRGCTKPPCCCPSWSAWSTSWERTRSQSRRPCLSPPRVPITRPGAGGRRQLTTAYLVCAGRRFGVGAVDDPAARHPAQITQLWCSGPARSHLPQQEPCLSASGSLRGTSTSRRCSTSSTLCYTKGDADDPPTALRDRDR